MSSSDIAVSVRGLSKSYTIAHQGEKHSTLAETLLAKARNPFKRTPKETFWALKDVNFDIKKGEVVGIIGRNGAGKSTLLKILSRITEPTAGQIDLYGRVGSLLEVGTGFHPELTGRENVFLNGAILGMTKAEIRKQFDAIVDFAGVEKFLDTPVKRYSSGMYVRLAFSVAAHLRTELLMVDEVLAVGDASFQSQCLGVMSRAASEGRTILFVTHSLATVRAVCTSALVLARGAVQTQGAVDSCLDSYTTSISRDDDPIATRGRSFFPGLHVISISVDGAEGGDLYLNEANSPVLITVEGKTDSAIPVDLEMLLIDLNGMYIGQASPTRYSGNLRTVGPGKFSFETSLVLPTLNRGSYILHLMLNHPMTTGYWECVDAIRIHFGGSAMADGSVLDARRSGPLLLDAKTNYGSDRFLR